MNYRSTFSCIFIIKRQSAANTKSGYVRYFAFYIFSHRVAVYAVRRWVFSSIGFEKMQNKVYCVFACFRLFWIVVAWFIQSGFFALETFFMWRIQNFEEFLKKSGRSGFWKKSSVLSTRIDVCDYDLSLGITLIMVGRTLRHVILIRS